MSKSEREDSEACCGVLFKDSGIEKKTEGKSWGGRIEDVKIFIGNDPNGQD